MSEIKKIGIACAIGGAIGTAVALIVATPFWWLGLLSGFAGGYLSYEFRAVLRAVPMAWEMTLFALGTIGSMIGEVFLGLWAFFMSPILHFIFVDLVLFIPMLFFANAFDHHEVALFSITGVVGVTGCVSYLVFFLAQMIAADGQVLGRLTYREVFVGWMKCALGALALWVGLLTIPVWGPFVLAYFLYRLFLLIHSDKRLLCGVDSAIGTGVTYLALIAAAAISAVLGIVNYELVSKRWLRVEERATRS